MKPSKHLNLYPSLSKNRFASYPLFAAEKTKIAADILAMATMDQLFTGYWLLAEL